MCAKCESLRRIKVSEGSLGTSFVIIICTDIVTALYYFFTGYYCFVFTTFVLLVITLFNVF